MKETITCAELPELFESVATIMKEKSGELCAMDAQLGDGDLGLTMSKGFGALPQLLRDIEEENIGKRLMKAGMKMSSVVPSTMGTLMSSGIMNGGKSIMTDTQIDAPVFLKFLKGFAEGIIKRGKCQRGERTVLDAILPAVDRLTEALANDPALNLAAAGAAAVEGAREGVNATRNMTPKYGKAAVHKAAAVGKVDQGACAGLYMIQGLNAFFQNG